MAPRHRSPPPLDATFPGLTADALERAQAAWRALDRAAQFRLAEEIVQVRGHELRRAYPDLVGIGFGFATRAGAGAGAGAGETLVREPCVVFTVAVKRALAGARHAHRRLPRTLFAYVGDGDARVLCAVPTDVKDRVAFGRPVPHGDESTERPFAIIVEGEVTTLLEQGSVAACVRRESRPGVRHALSCRHVLSRSAIDPPEPPVGQRVDWATQFGPLLGATDAARGTLAPAPAESFDAQFVRVADDDVGVLQDILAGLSFDLANPVLARPDDTPDGFWIATSRADDLGARVLVWATFLEYVVLHPIPYAQPGGGTIDVTHVKLIHARVGDAGGALVKGDSGSPAVLLQDGGRLVGMYIGGDGADAYFIPGWQLLQPTNYGLPADEVLSIDNP
jgi:hypothetical protein